MNRGVTLLHSAQGAIKRALTPVFLFSLIINILLLTTPLFMLQVYDRVLLSGSKETLFFLFMIALLALIGLGVLDSLRGKIMTRLANRLDAQLGAGLFEETLKRSPSSQPIQDLNTLRQFVASPYLMSLFDAPWIPLFIGLVYLLHPMLGHLALGGAIVLAMLGRLNDRLTRTNSRRAGEALGQANRFTEQSTRHREAVLGMGMAPALSSRWTRRQQEGLFWLSSVQDRSHVISTLAKVIRQLLQVGILAVGAWLTLEHITTAGVMIAASIITARALAPIEQSIQGWRSLSSARQSLADLETFLSEAEFIDEAMPLPRPRGAIRLEETSLLVSLPGQSSLSARPVVQSVSFTLAPGRSLGIIGASGSGKTSLVRLILGIVPASSGEVRIDGAEMNPTLREQFSQYLGYLPQDIELFDGTVAENIARFGGLDSAQILEAAQLAGAHELILSLPQGYDTPIGPGGLPLSGGQRQRIGLARALFGNPAVVVLDEPTSNLDPEGQQRFMQTLRELKTRNTTVITISHQPNLLVEVDRIAVMSQGRLERIGTPREILNSLQRPAASAGANRRVLVKKGAAVVNLQEKR